MEYNTTHQWLWLNSPPSYRFPWICDSSLISAATTCTCGWFVPVLFHLWWENKLLRRFFIERVSKKQKDPEEFFMAVFLIDKEVLTKSS
jgi:hypothetical protein